MIVERLDELQRRFRVTAFAFAVQKKFSEDRGSYLAALITYYGFLSVFPLLLASFTVAAYVLAGDHSAIATVERHLGSYPVIGPAVKQLEGENLRGSPIALAVGVLGLVWGAQGLAHAAQFCMDEAWNIAGRDRPGFLPQLLRGLAWYIVVGIGIVASTFVTSLGPILRWSGGPALSALIAALLNVGVFLLSFRILSPEEATLRALLPGAAVAGTVWTVLTGVGVGLAHKLAHSNALYGSFAPVLALLAFLYLTARVTIYCIEANVVWTYHLWPRSLTGKDMVTADRVQLANLAKREERVKHETVTVEF
jgi:YihY family inner membrane protein